MGQTKITDDQASADTHVKRRLLYGLNVTVAIAIALALVILVNWIGKRGSHRWDLTSLSQYTLSDQTRQVVDSLDGQYEIVTLFTAGPQARATTDLINEYENLSDNLIVQHLNPATDVAKRKQLFARIHNRFGKKLKSMAKAINDAQNSYDAFGQTASVLAATLQNYKTENVLAIRLRDDLIPALYSINENASKRGKKIKDDLNHPMPHYTSINAGLMSELDYLIKQLGTQGKRYREYVRQQQLPDDFKTLLNRTVTEFEKAQKTLRDAFNDLHKQSTESTVPAYERVRAGLFSPTAKVRNSVLIIGPKQDQIHVLQLVGDIYAQGVANQASPANTHRSFEGEERITGALISMTRRPMPLVVFVTDQTKSPFAGRNPGKRFASVAQRLVKMNFQVGWYTPTPKRRQGQLSSQALPEPKGLPGQKVVWIVLMPDSSTNPQDMIATGARLSFLGKWVNKKLKADANVLLLMTEVKGGPFVAQNHPLVEALKPWGIEPHLGTVVLKTQTDAEGKPLPGSLIETTQWSQDLAVSSVVKGLPGMFVRPAPITIMKNSSAKIYPLLTLKGPNLVTVDTNQPDSAAKAPQNPDAGLTIAMAASKAKSRLILITDKRFVTDAVTTRGITETGQTVRADLVPGAAIVWPGNTELFVNSVCWLSRLEELIARSARTQDVPRIQLVDQSQQSRIKWTLVPGMPIAILICGLAVWLVRRRS